VLKRYREEMMDNALKSIEADRQAPPEKRFAWTVAGWPMKHILGPEQDPARRERIVQAMREGALVVHALPGSLHTESFDLEDLVRGLTFSAKIARDLGRPLPIAAKMTDVPEHCWVMPTLLSNAGIKFLQIGCNGACQYLRFPRLFWWEGPDSSRILCNYTIDYGSPFNPPADWPSKNYLAMVMTGDNAGPPSVAEVEQMRDEFAKSLPGVRVHFATLDDFAKAVLAENPDLPVVRADTPDTWIHGLLSMPIETKTARNIRPLEPALDALDTELRCWKLPTAPLAAPLAEAYESSFLYGEHTWGFNGTYGGNRLWGDDWKNRLPVEQQQNFLGSFDDHRNYIRKTDKIVRRELGAPPVRGLSFIIPCPGRVRESSRSMPITRVRSSISKPASRSPPIARPSNARSSRPTCPLAATGLTASRSLRSVNSRQINRRRRETQSKRPTSKPSSTSTAAASLRSLKNEPVANLPIRPAPTRSASSSTNASAKTR
jgi:hypothetical protein